MKMRLGFIAAVIITVAAALTFPHNPPPRFLTVKHIIDGDTLIAYPNRRVRLWGIDAPEAGTARGDLATKALAILIPPGTVLQCKRKHTDSHERDVMRCVTHTKNGQSVAIDIAQLMLDLHQACEWSHYSHGFYGSTRPCR